MKTMKPINVLKSLGVLFLLLLVCNVGFSQNDRVSITGYGEINFSSTFGESPDEEAAELYEDFGLIKEYSEPRNDIVFPGIGVVFTANLQDEKLSFLSEINYRTKFNKIELGIERCYLNYNIDNRLQIQTGIYSAPIGSLNVMERNHGYLGNSIRVRDMVNLEYGLIPTRIFGIKLHGAFETSGMTTLNYVFSVGSGRGLNPTQSPFEIDLFEEQESSLSLSGGLELDIPVNDGELKLGLSGFVVPKFNSLYFDSLGVEIDIAELDEIMEGEEEEGEEEAALELMQMSEMGFAPYVRYNGPKFELIAELHTTVMKGLEGDVEDEEFNYTGFSAELAYKTRFFNKKFVPYVRYDYTSLPENGGYYYGLHIQNDELKRFLITDNNVFMLGASWNVFTFNKIKLEYHYVFDGPQPAHGIMFQTAFVF